MSTTDQTTDRPADRAALVERYRIERDKRLRPDGPDQYVEVSGRFARFVEDPYVARVEREPLFDEVTVAFIGGGFAGLVTGARLKQAGIERVRLIEKGGDVGGTWYWNRYPGAQCDTHSFVYMPLLEETGHVPSEKYTHGPEILEHSRRIAEHFGLYDDACLQTEVTSVTWDPEISRWIIRTDRGDEMRAKYVAIGTGPLHKPKLPGIPGLDTFAGHAFHTSRWDYDYTGGDPLGAPLDRLADKRVAVIGTGATAVQCIPHLARAARELYVFQRTPSSIDVRANEPVDPEWFADDVSAPGWQEQWLRNFCTLQTGGFADEDLVQDGWTDIARRIRDRVVAEMTARGALAEPAEEGVADRTGTGDGDAGSAPRRARRRRPAGDGDDAPGRGGFAQAMLIARAFEDCDFEKMEEIRSRVEQLVDDPATAEALKPWYRQLCKRPCFHDEYLQSYNEPGAHLVDTDGKGVERITERGVVANGAEYEVDCIIYASGFEVGTDLVRRTGFDVTGRNGVTLSEYWAEGMRSLHGMHVHGFPNLFVVGAAQGGNLISNYPHNLSEAARNVAAVVARAEDDGVEEVEVTAEAEKAWIDLLLTGTPGLVGGNADCTPGYYNNEGQPGGDERRLNWSGYPHGPVAFFELMDQWRSAGDFDGLEFRT